MIPIGSQILLLTSLNFMNSAFGVVEDWFIDKGIVYRQTGDDTQPSAASGRAIVSFPAIPNNP